MHLLPHLQTGFCILTTRCLQFLAVITVTVRTHGIITPFMTATERIVIIAFYNSSCLSIHDAADTTEVITQKVINLTATAGGQNPALTEITAFKLTRKLLPLSYPLPLYATSPKKASLPIKNSNRFLNLFRNKPKPEKLQAFVLYYFLYSLTCFFAITIFF